MYDFVQVSRGQDTSRQRLSDTGSQQLGIEQCTRIEKGNLKHENYFKSESVLSNTIYFVKHF